MRERGRERRQHLTNYCMKKRKKREREKTHIITIAERTNGGYQTVEDSPSMLCPVDIKIKTSSHRERERLVEREVWEQSRRRRRGDLQSQRFRSQRRMICSKREIREKTEKTDAALPVYFTTPNGERGMGGMGGEVMKKI